jgi:hypothetical protein
MSLFPFPPHHDTAGDVCKSSDTTAPILAEVKNTLDPRSGRDGFVCDNVSRLLAYPNRAGVIVADIVDADGE